MTVLSDACATQEHAELVRLRQECGQLRAERADLAAQAQGLNAELAGEQADNAALRHENLELATELNEASRDRHATEDAHHVLRERCSELQVCFLSDVEALMLTLEMALSIRAHVNKHGFA